MTRILGVSRSPRISQLPLPQGVRPFSDWSHAYPEQAPPPPRVRWFADSPSIFVGSWEELAFRKRSGLAWTDESAAYRQEFSDQTLDQIAEMGCNHLVLPQTKGYGLTAVGGELDYLRDVIRRAHARGLKIGLYLRLDSVVPEILRNEYPDVDQWLTVGSLGRPSHYSSQQTFRWRICHLHPSAMRYLQREIQFAVENMGADLLHFDGMHFSFYPNETCRCARCLEHYQRWLRQAYADDGVRGEVFGPADFDQIQMPDFDPLQQSGDPGFAPFRGLGDFIRSPDIQSWYRFRWDGELALVRHLRRFVHQLNPDVAISINPAWGSTYNGYRVFTSWAERLMPWVDAIWSEDSLHMQFEQGRIISKVGTYKIAREHDVPICNYHWMREPGRLEASLALSAAANANGSLACMGFTIRHLPHYRVGYEVKQKFAQWVNANKRLFINARPAAEIALLRHQPSLAWNSRSPWWSAMACEQLLVQMQVPWRMFDAIDGQRLKTIRTLLLPDAMCLSDDEIDLLLPWMRQDGGRIFITPATASHNPDLRRRPRNPLASLVPAWTDALAKTDEAEQWFDWIEGGPEVRGMPPSIADVGRGRIGVWPEIRGRCAQSATFNYLDPDQWWPPEQADELAAFVNRLHGDHSVAIERAGAPTMIEHHRSSDGKDFVHLIQVAEHAEPVELVLRGTLFGPDRSVKVHSLSDSPPKCQIDVGVATLGGATRYTILEIAAPHGAR